MPVLLEALKGGDPHARARAACWIGRIGAEARDAAPALVEALEDEASVVRAGAIAALQDLKPDPRVVVERASAILRSERAEAATAAAWALAGLGPAARPAVPALLDAVRSPAREVVEAALGALEAAAVEDLELVPVLLEVLSREESRDFSGLPGLASPAAAGLARRAEAALPVLLERLRAADPARREEAAGALSVLFEPGLGVGERAKGALERVLEDPEPRVRLRAAQGLWRVAREPAAVAPALRRIAAEAGDAALRGAAEGLLREIEEGSGG
ncbi:MAG: HEAT repeat domain-containing protein [Planctomycetes bacterium]|nr:HEAT repeat domain-containing protein [Planctomycetota bacterium]